MPTKRLYQITDTHTKKPVPEIFFADKQLAKAKRRELNEANEAETLRYVVSPGPDHRHYHHDR